jgi:hypothetical protein
MPPIGRHIVVPLALTQEGNPADFQAAVRDLRLHFVFFCPSFSLGGFDGCIPIGLANHHSFRYLPPPTQFFLRASARAARKKQSARVGK